MKVSIHLLLFPSILKKTAECKKIRDMKRLIHSLEAYVPATNNPLATKVAKQILDSDILFLHLKEIDDDDIEAIYEMIGSNAELCRSAAQYDSQDYKIHQNCTECYHNCWEEYLFGQYCVAAVKRYFDENKYTASVKDAYVVFVEHYNRGLDWRSFESDDHEERFRPSTTKKPPYCMKHGSLMFAMQWTTWQIENGPMTEFYDEKRKKKRKAKMAKEAQRITKGRMRYLGSK